ncbi:MAG: hypothetical protein MMC23_005907 [Stictis urceolatum]|nr:hypothetical protein [Stictis urceolata]
MTIPSERHGPSGISVIIVGAGFAGLTAAIECHRKGHTALVLESFSELKILGDIISFAPNSGKIFERWPGVREQLLPICIKTNGVTYRSYLGEHLFYQSWDKERSFGTAYNGHRGEIHEIVYNHAKSLGIEIRLGQKVTEYFETGTDAGIVSNGERLEADAVLAADGVRSTGRKLVLGYDDRPKSSGYAVYRAWFDSKDIAANPRTKFLVENGDTHSAWLGPDIHFISASIKDGKDFSWVCTHKDEADMEESWQQPGSVEDALKVLEGWDPVVHDIVKATPSLIDWKLVYRDPLPTWVSPKGRIALIGDAAHPFLPTSIQGASQSMEDGATLAVTLALAGKANVPDALHGYEKIRYDRVRQAQKTGETTRDKWHKADFAKIKEDPEKLKLVREPWLLNFDAEAHAYEVWEETLEVLREGDAGSASNGTSVDR